MGNPIPSSSQTVAPTSQWPTITVITPSYNQGKYIEICLRSVLDQGYPNLEYIVIDGDSKDESVAIIRRYADRLSFWVSEPDLGQSDAINKGFQRATGDLIAWLNSDDFYFPGALKAVAETFRQQPGAPFYFGDGWRVDAGGKPKQEFFPGGKLIFNRQALIHGLNFILQPSTFIYRPALERTGFLDPNLHYGLDTDLWIRLSALGDPVAVPVKLSASREYGVTKTATGSFKRLEELRQIAEKYSHLSVTPGYLCYYLDTLHSYIEQHPDLYPEGYLRDIEAFWGATSALLARYGARPDGFPTTSIPPNPEDYSRVDYQRKTGCIRLFSRNPLQTLASIIKRLSRAIVQRIR